MPFCTPWAVLAGGSTETPAAASVLLSFSLDLTLPVLALGLQSKSHKSSPASQTTSFLCRASKPLPEAAPFPCYTWITLCTPCNTVPHLWVPPLNPGPPSSPLTRFKFHNPLNQPWIKSSHRQDFSVAPYLQLPWSSDEQTSWAITQDFPISPERDPCPLILRSLLQLTASLTTVFRLLPPISPCSRGLSNEEHLCCCPPSTLQSLYCFLSLMHTTNTPGVRKGGETWEPPFSLSSLARSNLPRPLIRNQSYRKAAQRLFIQTDIFLLMSYCSFSSTLQHFGKHVNHLIFESQTDLF